MAILTLPVTPAGAFEVIIRTFIPASHPSLPGYMLPVPGQPGKTMLPKAPLGQCFGTDNRSFSTGATQSSRYGGRLTIDPSSLSASVHEITGVTTEYDCASGATVCSKTSGSGGFKITSKDISGDTLTVRYSGEAANPCFTTAPDIEFSGALTINRSAKTVSLQGKVDCFPSFEAVLVKGDGTMIHLYKLDPESGATPTCLLTSAGGGSRTVSSPPITY